MANYPKELAQDAAYQSHSSRLFWSLPRPAQGLNTNNNNNNLGYDRKHFWKKSLLQQTTYGVDLLETVKHNKYIGHR